MLSITPDALIADCKTLPQSPRQLQQLLHMLEDPNNAMDPLLAMIRAERSLAAQIVRLANSSVYASAAPCGSIEEAVPRLGFQTVHRVATTMLGLLPFAQPLRVYDCTPQTIWQQSVFTAIAARELSGETGDDPQRAYTLGLLSGVGMVAIDRWVWPRVGGRRITSVEWPEEWRVGEIRLLGYDQAEVGAAMLHSWGFPSEMVEGHRFQFRPATATGQAQRYAALLQTAAWLRGGFFRQTRDGQSAECPALPLLELSPDLLPTLTQKISVEFYLAWTQLGLDGSGAKEFFGT